MAARASAAAAEVRLGQSYTRQGGLRCGQTRFAVRGAADLTFFLLLRKKFPTLNPSSLSPLNAGAALDGFTRVTSYTNKNNDTSENSHENIRSSSRVMTSWVRNCLKYHGSGRAGSLFLDSHGSGRAAVTRPGPTWDPFDPTHERPLNKSF